MEIKEYKCPNCSGAVNFDSSLQKMKCPYCDTLFETAALEEYQKELAFSSADNFAWALEDKRTWEDSSLDDLGTGSCPSCGAELIGDKNTVATVCPFCGGAQIISHRLSGTLKPDYVIPFVLDKKAAMEALKNFYHGKRLLPDFFKEDNHVNSVQGVYLPFWLFDAMVSARIRYRASRTKSWSDSHYNFTRTDYYSVVRSGSIGFEKVPVDASEKTDDAYMDSIGPFDYSKTRDFQSAFLAGYTAEKYDIDAERSGERAGRMIKAAVEKEFARSVTGYSSVRQESSSVNTERGSASYALFPVWILNTRYKKENYRFMMNGESGRLVGRLPCDPSKCWKYRLLFTGIAGALFTVVIQTLRILL
jgi:DNA-directed RNA polymerase subunit RPC12/RpoP